MSPPDGLAGATPGSGSADAADGAVSYARRPRRPVRAADGWGEPGPARPRLAATELGAAGVMAVSDRVRLGTLVSCATGFYDAVLALAGRRGVTPAALASGVLALTDPDRAGIEDPGGGPALLQLVRPVGLAPTTVRRALALALRLADPAALARAVAPPPDPVPDPETIARLDSQQRRIEQLEYRNDRLLAALDRISFQPHDGCPRDVREAAAVLGLAQETAFDEQRVTRRFRELAPLYHPDTGVLPSRGRMAQLIDARNLLIRHLRVRRG